MGQITAYFLASHENETLNWLADLGQCLIEPFGIHG